MKYDQGSSVKLRFPTRITQEGNSADTNVFTREPSRAVHLFSTDETFLHPHICILEEHERIRLCRRHTSGFQ